MNSRLPAKEARLFSTCGLSFSELSWEGLGQTPKGLFQELRKCLLITGK